MHPKHLNTFENPDSTTDYGVSCLRVSRKIPIDIYTVQKLCGHLTFYAPVQQVKKVPLILFSYEKLC